jgi:hypothetical protein
VYLHCLVHKLLHGQLYTHLYVGYIVFYFIFCIVVISGSRCKSWLYYNMELRWFFCTYGPSQVINQMLMIELKFWIQLFMSTAVYVLKMLGSSTGLTSATPTDVCCFTNLWTAAMARLRIWLWSSMVSVRLDVFYYSILTRSVAFKWTHAKGQFPLIQYLYIIDVYLFSLYMIEKREWKYGQKSYAAYMLISRDFCMTFLFCSNSHKMVFRFYYYTTSFCIA